jgi:hypothetical protein
MEESVPPLMTREEGTSERHKSNTPQYSYPKTLGAMTTYMPKSPKKLLAQMTPNQTATSPLIIPSMNKKFSPSPIGGM